MCLLSTTDRTPWRVTQMAFWTPCLINESAVQYSGGLSYILALLSLCSRLKTEILKNINCSYSKELEPFHFKGAIHIAQWFKYLMLYTACQDSRPVIHQNCRHEIYYSEKYWLGIHCSTYTYNAKTMQRQCMCMKITIDLCSGYAHLLFSEFPFKLIHFLWESPNISRLHYVQFQVHLNQQF